MSNLSLACSLEDMDCTLPVLGPTQSCQESIEAGCIGVHPCCLHHGPTSIGLLTLPRLTAASHNPCKTYSIDGQPLYMTSTQAISRLVHEVACCFVSLMCSDAPGQVINSETKLLLSCYKLWASVPVSSPLLLMQSLITGIVNGSFQLSNFAKVVVCHHGGPQNFPALSITCCLYD